MTATVEYNMAISHLGLSHHAPMTSPSHSYIMPTSPFGGLFTTSSAAYQQYNPNLSGVRGRLVRAADVSDNDDDDSASSEDDDHHADDDYHGRHHYHNNRHQQRASFPHGRAFARGLSKTRSIAGSSNHSPSLQIREVYPSRPVSRQRQVIHSPTEVNIHHHHLHQGNEYSSRAAAHSPGPYLSSPSPIFVVGASSQVSTRRAEKTYPVLSNPNTTRPRTPGAGWDQSIASPLPRAYASGLEGVMGGGMEEHSMNRQPPQLLPTSRASNTPVSGTIRVDGKVVNAGAASTNMLLSSSANARIKVEHYSRSAPRSEFFGCEEDASLSEFQAESGVEDEDDDDHHYHYHRRQEEEHEHDHETMQRSRGQINRRAKSAYSVHPPQAVQRRHSDYEMYSGGGGGGVGGSVVTTTTTRTGSQNGSGWGREYHHHHHHHHHHYSGHGQGKAAGAGGGAGGYEYAIHDGAAEGKPDREVPEEEDDDDEEEIERRRRGGGWCVERNGNGREGVTGEEEEGVARSSRSRGMCGQCGGKGCQRRLKLEELLAWREREREMEMEMEGGLGRGRELQEGDREREREGYFVDRRERRVWEGC